MSRFSTTKPIQYGPKETFTWTYTKLRDWLICPRKHNNTRKKLFPEPTTTALAEGDAMHRAFQRRVQSSMTLPTAYTHLKDWGDDAAKLMHPLQITMVEKEIALTRDLKVTGYFDNNVWTRMKIDLVKLFPNKTGKSMVALLVDYKSGMPKDDIIQLAIYSQGLFSAFDDLIGIRAEYWWVKIKDKSHEMFERKDMDELWAELNPKLAEMERAYIEDNFPAKQNGLCKEYCPDWTCSFNGKKGKVG
jgi:hypothetical protein